MEVVFVFVLVILFFSFILSSPMLLFTTGPNYFDKLGTRGGWGEQVM